MDLLSQIIADFDKGKFKEQLHSIHYGRVTDKFEENVNAEIVLDQDKKLVVNILRSKIPHDVLYGTDSGENDRNVPLWLSAKTSHGDFFLNIKHFSPDSITSHPDGTISMIAYPDFIEIHSNYSVGGVSEGVQQVNNGNIRGLLSISNLPIKNDEFVRNDENPMFGKKDELDWFFSDSGEVKVGIVEGNEFVNLGVDDSRISSNTLEFCQAVLHTLSFIESKPVHWKRFTINGKNGIEIHRLFTSITTPPPYIYPFAFSYYSPREGLTEFFNKAVDYFQSEHNISDLLYLCWYARDGGAFPLALQLCTGLESIANHIVSSKALSTEIQAEEDKYNTMKVAAIGALNDSELTKEPGFDRLQNVINSSRFHRQKDIILIAAKFLEITISDDEIKSWEAVRHPIAHGRYDIMQLSKLRVVYNMINKFVLAMIGYEGMYTDYSIEYWGRSRLLRNAPDKC